MRLRSFASTWLVVVVALCIAVARTLAADPESVYLPSADGLGASAIYPPLRPSVLLNTTMTGYTGFPAGVDANGAHKFIGAAVDGNGGLWLVPFGAAAVVRVETGTGSDAASAAIGSMSAYSGFPAPVRANDADKFLGGVVDGRGGLWLIPMSAAAVVRVEVGGTGMGAASVGTMTAFTDFPRGTDTTTAFKWEGGVMDGDGGLWLVPHHADRLVRVETRSDGGRVQGAMLGFQDFPAAVSASQPVKFGGGAKDGRGSLWLVPHDAQAVVQVEVCGANMGTMVGHDAFPPPVAKTDTGKAVGGVMDGRGGFWLVPYYAKALVRVEVWGTAGAAVGSMAAYTGFPSEVRASQGLKFYGGAIDDAGGLWLVPFHVFVLVRVESRGDAGNGAVGSMAAHGQLPSPIVPTEQSKFAGGVMDGSGGLWLVPMAAKAVVRVGGSDPTIRVDFARLVGPNQSCAVSRTPTSTHSRSQTRVSAPSSTNTQAPTTTSTTAASASTSDSSMESPSASSSGSIEPAKPPPPSHTHTVPGSPSPSVSGASESESASPTASAFASRGATPSESAADGPVLLTPTMTIESRTMSRIASVSVAGDTPSSSGSIEPAAPHPTPTSTNWQAVVQRSLTTTREASAAAASGTPQHATVTGAMPASTSVSASASSSYLDSAALSTSVTDAEGPRARSATPATAAPTGVPSSVPTASPERSGAPTATIRSRSMAPPDGAPTGPTTTATAANGKSHAASSTATDSTAMSLPTNTPATGSHATRLPSPTGTLTRSLTQPPSTDAPAPSSGAAAIGGAASAEGKVPLILGIGAAVAVVAVLVCLVLFAPVLLRAWRRRRRTGGGADGPSLPMQDRTNEYRWYDDAEAVAGDVEARGAASPLAPRNSSAGAGAVPLLQVPAPASGGPAAASDSLSPLLAGPVARPVEAPPMPRDLVSASSSVSTAAHPVNPLLRRCS